MEFVNPDDLEKPFSGSNPRLLLRAKDRPPPLPLLGALLAA